MVSVVGCVRVDGWRATVAMPSLAPSPTLVAHTLVALLVEAVRTRENMECLVTNSGVICTGRILLYIMVQDVYICVNGTL